MSTQLRRAGRPTPHGTTDRARRRCSGLSVSARVVVPFATVELARAHAATLESASRSHRGRDRSGRASQPAPCRRGRPGVRAEPSSRTGIPLLRLPDGSKGGGFSNSPWRTMSDLLSTTRPRWPGQGSLAETRGIVWRRLSATGSGLRPRRTAGCRWTDGGRAPPSVAGFHTQPTRRDSRVCRFFAPSQLRRAVLAAAVAFWAASRNRRRRVSPSRRSGFA